MRFLLLGSAVGQLFFDPTITKENIVIPEPVEVGPNMEADIRDPQLCDDKVKQHAGFIPFKGHLDKPKRFFFWLFEARNPSGDDTPLVLWLSGGPGCSSSLALFAENGPCKVVKNGQETVTNTHAWNERAHLLYVDQPAGTGWSEGSFVTGEEGVGDDMFVFLQKFYEALPQYQKNPFYITGESYAGHYIPAIAHRVLKSNRKSDGFRIPLQGMAIGNGLTNPEEQYKWYAPMARDGGQSEGGTTAGGKISAFSLKIMEAAIPGCVAAIKKCNTGTFDACDFALTVCQLSELLPFLISGLNPYDMREKCKVPPLCYDFEPISKFLNREDVKKKLGVSAHWRKCSRVVNLMFTGDWMKNYQQLLPELLDSGIKVLIYAGDSDFICNWLGNKHWTLKLKWDGKAGFNQAADEPYMVNKAQAGRRRSFKGLSFLQVYQAGHMVPMNQPEVALQMINEFIGVHATSAPMPQIIVA
eukprot:GEMP01024394.1.p1 GENE.GEMP01024394.1~~GEMP01024394.1.p1  ORF type:complete len:471 (+),score=123.55 GEMP01024394.1:77-1489(+)